MATIHRQSRTFPNLTTGRSTARSASLALVLALASLTSCGSDTGGASPDGGGTGGAGADSGGNGGTCKAVAACGGDLVGRWTITDNCVVANADLNSVCAGATATLVYSFNGGMTLNADLTYTQTGTSGGTVHYLLPSTCISGQTCAQVQANLSKPSSSGAGMGLNLSSVVCSSSAGGGCGCDGVIASAPANETGTYTTANGILSTTHDGKTDAAKYCVEGATMRQMPTDDPNLQATGSIVLTRQ
jgi:hypothetical protein